MATLRGGHPGPHDRLDKRFCIYITNKRNGTIYIGVTNDLARRVYEHRCARIGCAKFHNEATARRSLALFREVCEPDARSRFTAALSPDAFDAAQPRCEARQSDRAKSIARLTDRRKIGCLVILSASALDYRGRNVIRSARPRPGHHPTGGRHHDLRQPGDDGGSGSGGIIGTVLAIYGRLNAAGALTLRKG